MAYPIEVSKQISISKNVAEEVPNQDYIEYIVNKMINPGKEKKLIPIFNDDKTHIPIHYDINEAENSNMKIDFFFDAAETLSNSILEGAVMQNKLLDNIDNCYASILIDCSNTFSLIQKASLILLTIAYGNALTALKIPYSIIIFCDDNFQFILKKLEDKHEKSHYLKLIEAMTVNRRMSSMTDAIQMARKLSIPSPTGPYSKRKNHVIYTLTDGLSTKLNYTRQWKEMILNDNLVSVSFFFLNIVSEDKLNDIVQIWSNFANKISNSQSPTSIFYSNFESILTNKQIFNILTDSNNNDNQLTKVVSICDCFSMPIIQSNNDETTPTIFLRTSKLESINFDVKYPSKILKALSTVVSDESKYYINSSSESQIDELIEFKISSNKIEPFYTNIIINESLKERNLYSSFHSELYKISSMMIDQSNIQEMSTFIFPPNRPTQYAPSSDGTLFYFPGLIRFLLTQGQDTKIFLEKKAGLTKSYSIFVVIDCTTSCFNMQSSYHAIQTIFVLLQTIAKIDLPSFNLIITTDKGPKILCCEKSTFDALSSNSSIWITLFSCLLNPHENSYLDSALLSILSIRTQQKALSSVLFIFTDGNFSKRKQKINNSILEFISSYNVESITIGIGSISTNINLLSTKKVWSENPRNVVKSILAVFGKETNDLIQNISSLFKYKQIMDYKEIGLTLSSYLEFKSIDDYKLKDLIIELNSITRDVSVFSDFYNIKNDGNEVYSEDSSHDIGKKNMFKGTKILICQFWDETMSYNEDEYISKEVLINGSDNKHRSVVNTLKDFGIETTIVQNYKDAIECLSCGKYSQAWIICGRFDGRMPDNSKTAKLISPFIDSLILYWNNGGGIVFWTDNSPLDAEVNFFLSKAKFDEVDQIKFRIGGSYPGNKFLHKSNKLRRGTFTDEQMIQCNGYKKWLFNANMDSIFEGKTIASAIIPPPDSKNECYDEKNYTFANGKDIYPFKYFSISSSGGISSLYYNSPWNSPKGDIVIDCGFSKLFYELNEDSIYYYVRNIAYFMLSIEKRLSTIGGPSDPKKFRPKSFNPRFLNSKDPKFYSYNEERAVDIVFLIDATGSMEFLIDAVFESCNEIAQYCHYYFSENSFKFGAIIYRDNAVKEIKYNLLHYKGKFDETDCSGLNKEISILEDFLDNVVAKGGGNDGPEDWLSGYSRIKSSIRWRPNSEKVIIHIADSPSHGRSFNNGYFNIPYFTNDREENEKLYLKMDDYHDHELPNYIKWVAEKGIRLFCLSSTRKSTVNSFRMVEKIYNEANGKQFTLTQTNFYSENVTEEKKNEILKIVKKVALSSVDAAVAVVSKKKQHKPPPPPPQPIPRTRKRHEVKDFESAHKYFEEEDE